MSVSSGANFATDARKRYHVCYLQDNPFGGESIAMLSLDSVKCFVTVTPKCMLEPHTASVLSFNRDSKALNRYFKMKQMLLMAIDSYMTTLKNMVDFSVIEVVMAPPPPHRAHIANAKGEMVELRSWLIFDANNYVPIVQFVRAIIEAAHACHMDKDSEYLKHVPLEFYRAGSDYRLTMSNYIDMLSATIFMRPDDVARAYPQGEIEEVLRESEYALVVLFNVKIAMVISEKFSGASMIPEQSLALKNGSYRFENAREGSARFFNASENAWRISSPVERLWVNSRELCLPMKFIGVEQQQMTEEDAQKYANMCGLRYSETLTHRFGAAEIDESGPPIPDRDEKLVRRLMSRQTRRVDVHEVLSKFLSNSPEEEYVVDGCYMHEYSLKIKEEMKAVHEIRAQLLAKHGGKEDSNEFKVEWNRTRHGLLARLINYMDLPPELAISKRHWQDRTEREKLLRTRENALDFDLKFGDLPLNLGISSMKYAGTLRLFEKKDTHTGHQEIWCIWMSGLSAANLDAGESINILAAGVGGIGKSRSFNCAAAMLVPGTYRIVGRGTAMAQTGERRGLSGITQIHHEPMGSLMGNKSGKGKGSSNPDIDGEQSDSTQMLKNAMTEGEINISEIVMEDDPQTKKRVRTLHVSKIPATTAYWMAFNTGIERIGSALLTRFHKMSFGAMSRADGLTINDVMWSEESYKRVSQQLGDDVFPYQIISNMVSLYLAAQYMGIVEPPSLDIAYLMAPTLFDVLEASGTKCTRSRENNRIRVAMSIEAMIDACIMLYGTRVTEGSVYRPPGTWRYEDIFVLEAMMLASESTVLRCFEQWGVSQLETQLLDYIMSVVCDVFANGRVELWSALDEDLFVSRPDHHALQGNDEDPNYLFFQVSQLQNDVESSLVDRLVQGGRRGQEYAPTSITMALRALAVQWTTNHDFIDPHEFTTKVVAGTGLLPAKGQTMEKAFRFPIKRGNMWGVAVSKAFMRSTTGSQTIQCFSRVQNQNTRTTHGSVKSDHVFFHQVLQNALWVCESILRSQMNHPRNPTAPDRHSRQRQQQHRSGVVAPPVVSLGNPFAASAQSQHGQSGAQQQRQRFYGDEDDVSMGSEENRAVVLTNRAHAAAIPNPPPFVGGADRGARGQSNVAETLQESCRKGRPSLHSHLAEGPLIYRYLDKDCTIDTMLTREGFLNRIYEEFLVAAPDGKAATEIRRAIRVVFDNLVEGRFLIFDDQARQITIPATVLAHAYRTLRMELMGSTYVGHPDLPRAYFPRCVWGVKATRRIGDSTLKAPDNMDIESFAAERRCSKLGYKLSAEGPQATPLDKLVYTVWIRAGCAPRAEHWYSTHFGKKHVNHLHGYPECFIVNANGGKRSRLETASEDDMIATLKAHLQCLSIAQAENIRGDDLDPSLADDKTFEEFKKLLMGEAMAAPPSIMDDCGLRPKALDAGSQHKANGIDDDEMYPVPALGLERGGEDDDDDFGAGVGLGASSSSSALMPARSRRAPGGALLGRLGAVPQGAPSFLVRYSQKHPFRVMVDRPSVHTEAMNSFKPKTGKSIGNLLYT